DLPAAATSCRNPLRSLIMIKTSTSFNSAATRGERLSLRLSDNTERFVDHMLLATGYRVDISRYPFLTGQILESIRRINGYPQLDSGFQTSMPGLHFLGAPAAWSFAPLMRFVAGAEFASRAVTRGILRKG